MDRLRRPRGRGPGAGLPLAALLLPVVGPRHAPPLLVRARRTAVMPFRACLLYTSDAADDM
eukprot:531066-Alexandrium_andersonii.AAC.1